MDKPLVNKVAKSGLITIRLEEFFPEVELAKFDLKDYLFMEMILKEKDFRTALKEHDWSQYEGKTLLVYSSADAIIPMWAYMLVAAYATPYAKELYQGTEQQYYQATFHKIIAEMDLEPYKGQRLVIKGCGDKEVPASAYLELTNRLQPHARSIMYGEPCSTVPIYKKPRMQ